METSINNTNAACHFTLECTQYYLWLPISVTSIGCNDSTYDSASFGSNTDPTSELILLKCWKYLDDYICLN